jgi:hypothetical protein
LTSHVGRKKERESGLVRGGREWPGVMIWREKSMAIKDRKPEPLVDDTIRAV